MKVLLNLRPLWAKYFLYGYNSSSIFSLNQTVYETFSKFINQNSEVDFHFVPFNTDSFGMSDIDCALRINDQVSGDNFKIEYAEMNFTRMHSYLRISKFDMAFCMRLHACVFSHFLDIKTVGIEYSDHFGKVAQFCDEFGVECTNSIQDLNLKYLEKMLNDHLSST